MKPLELGGKRFGRLTVQTFSHIGNDRYAHWNCKCDCGKTAVVSGSNLRRGSTVSCGCFKSERTAQRMKLLGKRSPEWKTKHGDYAGGRGSKEYRAWQCMKDRCYRSSDISFPSYGGRGIKVCDRWVNSFENFLADMGRSPSPELSRGTAAGRLRLSNRRTSVRGKQRGRV